jgi:hypothetical protein
MTSMKIYSVTDPKDCIEAFPTVSNDKVMLLEVTSPVGIIKIGLTKQDVEGLAMFLNANHWKMENLPPKEYTFEG